MMKAAVYRKYGFDNLHLEEVEQPLPKPNEVLVKVEAASLNSWDWDRLAGIPRIYQLISGVGKPSVQILGCDMAGTVVETGEKVTQFKVGDRVFGDLSPEKWGGFGEFLVANEQLIAAIPEGLSFTEAAAIPQAGVLAYQGLKKHPGLQSGQHLLINGAGGGVGTFAIQMAKKHGLEITCVDRGFKLDQLMALGAHHTIDFETSDFTTLDRKYDLILDAMACRPLQDYQRVLNPSGKYVMIGGQVRYLLSMLYMGPWSALTSTKKLGILAHKPNAEDLNILANQCVSGELKPIIDTVYPLDQIKEAFLHIGEGRVIGKVVVKIGTED